MWVDFLGFKFKLFSQETLDATVQLQKNENSIRITDMLGPPTAQSQGAWWSSAGGDGPSCSIATDQQCPSGPAGDSVPLSNQVQWFYLPYIDRPLTHHLQSCDLFQVQDMFLQLTFSETASHRMT